MQVAGNQLQASRGRVWGCAFSFNLNNPAKALPGVVPVVESRICSSCIVSGNVMNGTVMVVNKLDFEAAIWQSSPFPCDVNTITVSLRHKEVSILSICNPSVTISGLNNAVQDDGFIRVLDLLNNSTSRMGIWSRAGIENREGILQLNMSDFISSGRSDIFHFSFDIINPNFAQAAPDIKFEASIRDIRNSIAIEQTPNSQTMAPTTMNARQNLTVVEFSDKALPNRTIANGMIACRSAEPQGDYGNCVKIADNNNDRKALFVRKIFFTQKRIGQNNAEPCSHLTITITLETSVPLLTRCSPSITVSGLREAVELRAVETYYNTSVNRTQVNVSGLNVSDFQQSFAPANSSDRLNNFVLQSFNLLEGTMVLGVQNSTMAGVTYIIMFRLRHRAQASPGVTVSVSVETVQTNTVMHRSQAANLIPNRAYGYLFEEQINELQSGPGNEKPMKVKLLEFQGYAAQTSFSPCTNNTIWVGVDAVDVHILHSCSPAITISGLVNAQTRSGWIDVSNVDLDRIPASQTEHNTTIVQGFFSQEAGTLILNLTSFSFQYKTGFLFFFTLVNPTISQVNQRPRIVASISRPAVDGADRQQTSTQDLIRFSPDYVRRSLSNSSSIFRSFGLSNTSSIFTFEEGTSYSLPLHVKELDFTLRSIRQSSPYPCDENKIRVDLVSNIDLTPSCDFQITIQGLVNALNPNGEIYISAENGTGTIANKGYWTRSSGKLVFSLTAAVFRERVYSLGFVIVNPQKSFGEPDIVIQASTKENIASISRRDIRSQEMAESQTNAPANIYKSYSSYANTMEAWPLKVRNLQFEVKTIRQSTPHSGCKNAITVSLQTNVPLLTNAYCQPKIILSGFKNANVSTGKIGLVAQAGSCPEGNSAAFVFKHAYDGLTAFGNWANGSKTCYGGPEAVCEIQYPAASAFGSLELWTSVSTQPGQNYSFSFNIQNPLASSGTGIADQPSPDIYIQALSGDDDFTVPATRRGVPSFINGVTQQEPMLKSLDRPCCLCDVRDGDASPLVVKKAIFCKKKIVQSSPYPCSNNTLSVTISATTNLYANVSSITITGLNGAGARSGPLRLNDGSGGQGHQLFFAPNIGGQAGFGLWDDVAKTLTLQVVQDMDCSQEYFFAFTLKNPKQGQAVQAVFIEAKWLHLYHPTSLIEVAAMDHDLVLQPVPRGNAGDARPLYIWHPAFTTKTIMQSTSVPCGTNIISVSLRSSVPLYAACNLELTISGLTGSDTPSLPRRPGANANVTANVTGTNATGVSLSALGNSFPFESLGDWNNEPGTLKIRIISDVLETDIMSFSLTLKNPSRNPVPPPKTVKANCDGDILFLVSEMVLPGANDYADSSAESVKQMYPLYIDTARFTVKKIGQDSSWPCDQNTIFLNLVSSTWLLRECSPSITIRGITGMRTPSSIVSNFTIKDSINGNNRTGWWDQAAGSLTLNVSDFGERVQSLNISFVLRNPTTARQPISVSLQGSIVSQVFKSVRQPMTPPCATQQSASCAEGFEELSNLNFRDNDFVIFDDIFARSTAPIRLCPAGCVNSTTYCNTTIYNSGSNCTLCPLGCNRSDTRPGIPAHPIVEPAHGINWGLGSYSRLQREAAVGGEYGRNGRTLDDDVGTVREIFFVTNRIMQGAASGLGHEGTHRPTDPCSPITITVALASSVPFITACPTKLTITGLTDTPYFNDTRTIATINNAIPTEQSSRFRYVPGSWTQSTGSWEMDVTGDTTAGQDYLIQFNLLQRSAPNNGVASMSMATSGIVATAGLVAELRDDMTRPLRVKSLVFDRKYISQSSPFPCDNNTLTITLSLGDDSLFKTCRPNVTITGLSGSYTPDIESLPVECNSSGVATTGRWTNAGTLFVSLPFQSSEMNRKTWSLSFSLVNPRTENQEVQPYIAAELRDAKQVSQVGISISPLIRDIRIFTQLPFVCNSSNSQWNISGWGHDSAMASIPTVEASGVFRYLCGQYATSLALNEARVGLDRDRMPLRVRRTSFNMKSIGQSSPYPCDINT